MMGLLFMILLGGALLSATSLIAYYSLKNTEMSMGIYGTQSQLMMLTSAISAAVKYQNGKVLVPVNYNGTAVTTQVPTFLPTNKTTYNKALTYCPFSYYSPDGEYVTTQIDGFFYASSGSPSGLESSVSNKLKQANVVGYILAPTPKNDDTLNCKDITFRDNDINSIHIPGGFVALAYGSSSMSNALNSVASNEADLQKALSDFNTSDKTSVKIDLVDDIELLNDDLKNTINDLKGRTLILESSNDDPVEITLSSSNNIFNTTGDLVIRNIKFKGEPPLISVTSGHNVIIEKSDVGAVEANGGNIAIKNESGVISSNSPIVVNGGKVTIENNVDIAYTGSTGPFFKITGGELNLDNPKLLYTNSIWNSHQKVKNSIIQITNNGFVSGRDTGTKARINNDEYILSPLPRITTSCDTIFCSISCLEYGDHAQISNGECSSQNNIPLTSFGINRSETAEWFSCKWSVQPTQSTTISAECSY